MTNTLNIHRVNKIIFTKIVELPHSKQYTRHIKITQKENEIFDIILFSNTKESLKINSN